MVTFPLDLYMAANEVWDVLEAEYKLLAQCDGFKAEFDKHAEKCEVNVPGEISSVIHIQDGAINFCLCFS